MSSLSNIHELTRLFCSLTIEEDTPLCAAVRKNPHCAQLWKTLDRLDITYTGNEQFYARLIEGSAHADLLQNAFEKLHYAGIVYHGNERLYTALLENAQNTDKLTDLFKTLYQLGMAYSGNEQLYEKLIDKAGISCGRTGAVSRMLNTLKIPYTGNEPFYAKVIELSDHARTFAGALELLHEAGIIYPGSERLYFGILENISKAYGLANLFQEFYRAGATYRGNERPYESIIAQSDDATGLTFTFKELLNEGIKYCDNKQLYEKVIAEAENALGLAHAFRGLFSSDVTYRGNEKLFARLLENSVDSNALAYLFIELQRAGILYDGNEQLYDKACRASKSADHSARVLTLLNQSQVTFDSSNFSQLLTVNSKQLKFCLDSFARIGITPLTHPKCYEATTLIEKIGLLQHVLSRQGMQYSRWLPNSTFVSLLEKIMDEQDEYTISAIVEKLEIYVFTIFPADPDIQEVKKILEFSPLDRLARGPLTKSKITIAFERLLIRICQTPIHHVKISYESECYFIQIRNKKINLSLLIKNANLSQLALNDDVIESLGHILSKLIPSQWYIHTSHPIVLLLPRPQQIALDIYFYKYHVNINKFFRWEKLTTAHSLDSDNSKDMLICFLLGSLINDAINKLAFLPYQKEERKLLDLLLGQKQVDLENESEYTQLIKGSKDEEKLKNFFKYLPFFYPKARVFDRGEQLTNVRSRIVDKWTLPAITSLSAFENGVPDYHEGVATVRTTWVNIFPLFCVNERFSEVLLAQGNQVISHIKRGQKLISTITRSLTFDRNNHYLSDRALLYALQTRLIKRYSEIPDEIEIDGVIIFRPNHGLAHTYRVMLCIEQVIKYFSYFAADPYIKEYCISLSDEDMKWLEVASVFGSTGRESEIAAQKDLTRYNKYREKSAEHFIEFLKDSAEPIEPEMKYRLAHLIRYMGNPEFANDPNNKKYLFDYFIMTFAHKLDLLRCYYKPAYTTSVIVPLCKLSIESEKQTHALTELIRYTAELNKAHGNELQCDIHKGQLVEVTLQFTSRFKEASLSLKRVFELSQTVSKPNFFSEIIH